MANLLNVYHKSPYFLRVLIASARGYYLKRWRYGADLPKLMNEAAGREMWSRGQWQSWQDEQLAFLLHRSATQVPYYQRMWQQRRQAGDKASWELLENWPVLKKTDLREMPHQFIAEDHNPRKLFVNKTSGTTGTPLSIYISKKSLRKWYALNEQRLKQWHDISFGERWAIMGGQLVVPVQQKKPPFWVVNKGLNQLYLSTHHISPENAKFYARAITEFRPSYLVVYPSSAHFLAQIILQQELPVPSLKAVFSNAELLLPQQRKTIAAAFNCPVINTYGMGEVVIGAGECQAGNMHLWPEAGLLEVLTDVSDDMASAGEVGRFIATGLLNADMPLIRYEIGDRGSLALEDDHCSCGRSLPVIETIEGRLNDMLVTADGRRIFWLNPVFYGMPLLEAQIIQTDFVKVMIKYVPAPEFNEADRQVIERRLIDRMGLVHIEFQRLDFIPREKNGKFRGVVCQIPPGLLQHSFEN